MQSNRLTAIINKPIEFVFEFTTNPKNTPLWTPSIVEEIAEEYPPKINTEYKNRGKNSEWDYYKVVEFEENKLFTLKSLNGNYTVQYSYKGLKDHQTEMEYFEWVEEGNLEKPFTQAILMKLKSIMERVD